MDTKNAKRRAGAALKEVIRAARKYIEAESVLEQQLLNERARDKNERCETYNRGKDD